jgi:aminocarboxymuconate-semialdehyde decarboxylase
MSAIDVHAHVIVPELLREAAPWEKWRPALRRVDSRQVVELGGRRINSIVQEFVELDRILAAQERAGIDHVVLCPWVPLLFYDLQPDEGLHRCRLQNQGLARMRAGRPGRVSVLGAIPLQDPSLAAAELVELMASGVFAGVEITTSVGGTYLGDPVFAPFWGAAEATGALVFVHPTTRGFKEAVFGDYYLHNLVGNPMETTLTAAHMLLAGVMERHPDLKVLLAHGGGALVALRGRLRRGHEAIPAAGGALSEPADLSIRRFMFDSVTHDPVLLRELVEAVGADRVLLGSDYPFDMADPHPIETVRRAGLDPDEEEALLSGNAQRLLALEVR